MNATPEQAEHLMGRLDAWDALLTELEAREDVPREPLVPSRRILENYRRILREDMSAGIERVPAGELFRVISTANASIERLERMKADATKS